MDLDIDIIDGGCHCGGVRFRVRLMEGLRSARRCNCSYCRMRGAVVVSARLDDLQLTQGKAMLSCYCFRTHSARHYFCSRCGIHTHHRRRSHSDQYSVNVACLDGISPFDFAAVPVTEGRVHSRDRPENPGTLVAGTLYFEPAD